MTKVCTNCGEDKPLSAYTPQKRGRYGKAAKCKGCHSKHANEWNKKNRDRVRDLKFRRKYGITIEQYREMEKAQNGLCAICQRPELEDQILAVDHNHTTNKVRGLLCGNCNRGIGNLQDNPAVLYRAIEYLNRYGAQ